LRRAEAQGLNLLGFLSVFTQDPLTAKAVIEESVTKARADGDTGSLVGALALLGRAPLLLFKQALSVLRDVGDRFDIALVLSFLGWLVCDCRCGIDQPSTTWLNLLASSSTLASGLSARVKNVSGAP